MAYNNDMGRAILDREQRLNQIGIALSQQGDMQALLALILDGARELTNADGATIYTVTPEGALKFQLLYNQSLKFDMGREAEKPIPFADIPLKDAQGQFNDRFTVTYAVNHKESVNIIDAYNEAGFDFESTKKFDQKTGYRTRSVLAVPIMNHEGDVIALLQLINPLDGSSFSKEDLGLAESLASQAGVAYNNQLLIENLRRLFDSFLQVLAEAIDEKSPMTGNHAARVPVAATMIAEGVNHSGYAHLSDKEIYALKVAALLHDCGKITTPSYILEKKNKLETMCDQIDLVDARLMLRAKDLEIAHLKGELDDGTYHLRMNEIYKWRTIIQEANEGPVFDEKQVALDLMYQVGVLKEKEWNQLKVIKGNLTDEERQIMQNHVRLTIKMLDKLIFPKDLKRVPEIAGQHHEHLDGKGYPNQLTAPELSLESRMLAMADVFEALSAPDRPYKVPYPLSKILAIMKSMSEEGHLDPKLFEIFVSEKVYLRYAKQFLSKEQIDIN